MLTITEVRLLERTMSNSELMKLAADLDNYERWTILDDTSRELFQKAAKALRRLASPPAAETAGVDSSAMFEARKRGNTFGRFVNDTLTKAFAALTSQGKAGISRQVERPKDGDAFIGVVASLAAAISLLERIPNAKNAAPSDMMFEQMLADYRRALETARSVIKGDR